MKNHSKLLIVLISIILSSCKQAPDQNQELKSQEVFKELETAKNEESNIDTIQEITIESDAQIINRIDSINKTLNWKKTKSGLWKSKNGDLAFKRVGGIQEFITEVYIKELADGRPLAEVVDVPTFKYLGSSFYTDKNHVYTFFEMAGGGRTWIVEDTDVSTFRILGDCYAKDKKYVYGERAMKMDSVDYKTFKTCKGCGCFAKDKNGYYYWGDKIEDVNDITDKETLEIIKRLKKI